MPPRKKVSMCEVCGRREVTCYSLRGRWICSSCNDVFSAVSQRPEAVIKIMNEVHPELLFGDAADEQCRQLAEELQAINATLVSKEEEISRLNNEVMLAQENKIFALNADVAGAQDSAKLWEREAGRLSDELQISQSYNDILNGILMDIGRMVAPDIPAERMTVEQVADLVADTVEELKRPAPCEKIRSIDTLLLNLALEIGDGRSVRCLKEIRALWGAS